MTQAEKLRKTAGKPFGEAALPAAEGAIYLDFSRARPNNGSIRHTVEPRNASIPRCDMVTFGGGERLVKPACHGRFFCFLLSNLGKQNRYVEV